MFIAQIFLYIILIASPVLAMVLFLKMKKAQKATLSLEKRHFVTLRFLVPKNNEKTPLAAEQMFSALHGIFRAGELYQDSFSLEIVSHQKYIQFYANVPAHLRDFVEGQVYAQYPTVEIEEVKDYTQEISLDGRHIAKAELLLNKPQFFPIKTFLNFEVDPLSGITGVLSKVGPEEEIWIQFLIRPTNNDWQKNAIFYVSKVKSGQNPLGTLGKGLTSEFIGLFKGISQNILRPPVAEEGGKSNSGPTLPSSLEEGLKAVETKATKLGFETKVRLMALAQSEEAAFSRLHALLGAFKQFNLTNINGFEGRVEEGSAEDLALFQKRAFQNSGFVLNTEELASLFHLPNISVETPTIVWAGSKKGEPPSNLPIKDSVPDEELTIFGATNFRHIAHEFGIKLPDRRYHMYAIGKTGTGKSTMLSNMIIDDIKEGRGVAVVDPHGDLVRHILNFIPENRLDDVVYFNPVDRDYPLGFNILEAVEPDLKNIVASGVVGIFKKIFGDVSWGPRLEYILRNVILALLDYEGATLLEVMRVLTDKDFRREVVRKLTDPVIRDFFINEYEKYDPKFRTEAIAPIQNKVGQFLSSSTIRNIVGQKISTFDIEQLMNNRKILLMNLSIGEIGEDSSSLLGAMLITKIQLAAMRRAAAPEEERVDFYLYVDEFQNFATESFAIILSEARKYHLNLILTNQYIAQMPEVVASAVFGNVGTMVAFRVGATDAAFLVKEFEPVFDATDLVNLDNYYIYIKMSIDGVTSPAFSSKTLAPRQDSYGLRERIIDASRQKYGKGREEVEREIEQRTSSFTGSGGGVAANTASTRATVKERSQPVRVGDREYERKKSEKGGEWYIPKENGIVMRPGEKVRIS